MSGGNRANRNSASAQKASSLDAINQNPYVQKAKQKAEVYKNQMEKWLSTDENFLAPYLAVAERKTGVSRVVIFLVAVGILTLYLLFGAHAGLLSHIITFTYPALGSLRALETRRTDDDTKWLTYWVVFGFLGLFEHFGEAVLSVLPFYYVLKTGFQLWMCLPGVHNGSLIVYERVLRPVASRFLHIDLNPSLSTEAHLQAQRVKGQINTQANKAANYVQETTTRVREEINNKLD